MIKLLLLLSVFLPLYSTQNLYDLPRQHQAFLHQLQTMLRENDDIQIITPSFNHSEFKKRLIAHIKKGKSFTMIVQDPRGMPMSLVQYQGADIFLYDKRPLNGTIIITDTKACFLSSALDDSKLNEETGFGWCSDEAEILSKNRLLLRTLSKHATPYLK